MNKLTVVTVVFNARADFLFTLASVREQINRTDFEYLVVDGGSSDGTLDEIKSAAERGEIDRWVSEPDKGIYDAMNKAVGWAGGEWVLFLNTGDVFVAPTTLSLSLVRLGAADLAYGACEQVYPDGGVHLTPNSPLDQVFSAMPCSHQSLFARRSLLQRFPFDLRFRVAADHHFLARCFVAGLKEARWEQPVARVRLERYTWKQLAEGQRQKRDAMIDAGGPKTLRRHYALQTAALAVKHAVKRLIPASFLRSLWRG